MSFHPASRPTRRSRRRGPCSQEQPELLLDATPDPESESALRNAFERLGLQRYVTFEQAMADPAYAIGIRNFSHAALRRLRRAG